DGALGVTINQPSELAVESVLPAWSGSVPEPRVLFVGGPVARDSALAVGVAVGAEPVDGFKPLAGGYGLVDLDTAPELLVPELVGMRVFSGYSGWGDGQLEAEIAEGSWYVVDSVVTDLLNAEPEGLWRTVLRRQRGELAYVATYPDDPTMN
ncbi:MAG: YqgE/AlgH family protein, partial [Nocardioidaceae bacterium]